MNYNTENWAKRQIAKRLNTHQLISETYKETLRFMLGAFGGLEILSPENKVIKVPCRNASIERTVAKLYQENNIILPIITIAHSNTLDDENRRRTKDLLLNESYWDDTRKRAFRVISLAPRAITMVYEINIWTKYNEDMDQLVEQVRLIFSPYLNVVTKYSNSTPAFLIEESNDSVLVVGDREERIVRRKFQIQVESYLPYPKFLITSTGEITEFGNELEVIIDEDAALETSSANLIDT